MKKWIVFLIFIFAIQAFSCQALEQYVYCEEVGLEKECFSWTLNEKDEAAITSRGENSLFYNLCSLGGATLKWSVEKENENIAGERIGNEIHIRGRVDGLKVRKSYNIGEEPWFQPLSYSLRSFIRSGAEKIYFWTIRPDTLDCVRMKAIKRGVENVNIDGNRVKARKVVVRSAGMLSFFWHCIYWFEEDSGLFVQYEGVHGPPGTPKTVVRLASYGPS